MPLDGAPKRLLGTLDESSGTAFGFLLLPIGTLFEPENPGGARRASPRDFYEHRFNSD